MKDMHVIMTLIFVFIAVFGTVAMAEGETKKSMKTMTFSADDILMLPEIGAMISSQDGVLSVMMVTPVNARDDKYKDVDLQQGDLIKMINGKKMKTVEDIRKLYESLKEGDEIKFGLKRDKGFVMASLLKGDGKMPEGMMVQTMTVDMGEGEHEMLAESGTALSIEGEFALLSELGLLLVENKNQIEIKALLPGVAKSSEDEQFSEGDIVLVIAGTEVKTIAEFNKIYDNIEDGQKVQLKVKTKQTTITSSFVRSAGNSEIMIMKNK